MKKTTLTILLVNIFFASIISSCTKDYVEPEFVTKSFGIYTSFFNHSNGGANVNPTYQETYKIEGAMDISQGFLSHEWSFWKEVPSENGDSVWEKMTDGVKFLRKNCGLSYGAISDYTPYLDNSLKPTNSQDNIIFFFEKGGKYRLQIDNTYDKQIEYMYHEQDSILNKDINRYYKAELMNNGKYLVQRSYNFEVYDTLFINAKAYTDIACANEIIPNDSVIAVNQGETIYLRDATGTTKYDSGTSRQWNIIYINDGDEKPLPIVTPASSTDSIAAFKFVDKGNFRINLMVKRESKINHFPEESKTKTLPFRIKVK